jgi:hypothetical protein
MKTTIDFKGQKKFTRTVNFYKKQSNWNKILMQAGKNVAEDIKQDGIKRLFQKFNNVTGKLKKSFTSVVTRRGNNVFITFKSDHPAAGIMEYGGYVKMPAYTDDYDTNLNPYVNKWSGGNAEMYSTEDRANYMALKIEHNQPFAEGTFAFTNARRDGIKALEGEVIRVANRMKKEASGN